MTLQARLTLWSVAMMALIVGLISAINLGAEMDSQFKATLERATFSKRVAVDFVLRTLEREPTLPIKEALARESHLSAQLVDILTLSRALVEIAVCDPENKILVDSDRHRIGMTLPVYQDFRPVVERTGWFKKIQILLHDKSSYQLSDALAGEGQDSVALYVRVVVFPSLIWHEMSPQLQKHARISLLFLIGSIMVAFAFSSIAFRPLGKVGRMLDLVARGEYESQGALPGSDASADEFGVVASKVSLLGQQLRGVKYDFSDLKGNFERLLDELEDAVLIFGRASRLVVASGSVEKFLEKSRSELLGKSLPDIFPPTTPLGLLLAQAAHTGRPIRNRRVPLSRNGDTGAAIFVALLSVDILESLSTGAGAGAGMALLVRLRDPEATRRIGHQLQTAERLSAISRITGGVAHEVKNPLNAILMHVELVRMKLARGDYDLAPEIDVVSREIVRLDRVVKTFLDFTRPVQLDLKEISAEAFLNDIVELARPQAAAAGIKISIDQQAGDVTLCVDLDLLKQAVLNIVVNAIEAMPRGGELRFYSSSQGDDAEIRITDSGPGISPEVRDKIFKLYFTTKEKGSGIGLAMTFRIVQLHDGTIDFSSEPGKGTTFILRLPTAVSSC